MIRLVKPSSVMVELCAQASGLKQKRWTIRLVGRAKNIRGLCMCYHSRGAAACTQCN